MLQRNCSPQTAYSYNLCGWHTLSDIPLACLPPSVNNPSTVDVLIRIASGYAPAVTKSLSRGILQHEGEGWLIKIQGVADFEVIKGYQILIWPAPGATGKDVEIFVFGLAWATLCHQRGLLPLHASAIRTKSGIAAFAGPSGAGKSTTAALMSSLGYELVTDDLLPVSLGLDRVPGAFPYLRRLKLQHDTIIQLALPRSEVVSEKLDNEKYFVCPKIASNDSWTRLDRIYLLENELARQGVSIEQITGSEAVCALVDHTYYLDFVLDRGLFRDHLALCAQLACQIPIYRLRVSRSLRMQGKNASFVCAHLEGGASR